MKTRGRKSTVLVALIVGGCWTAHAQQPTVAPAAVTFSYQMGASQLIQQQKVVATLPAGYSGQTLQITNVVVALYETPGTNQCSLGASSTGCGWLSVTPSQGASPLTVMVTANPSSLTAGSYSGAFTVSNSTAPLYPVTVNVTLSISNPPSKLAITSAQFPLDSSGNPIPSLSFSYTTGANASTLATALIEVSSTGDIIPFTITAANAAAKGSSGSGTTPIWSRVTLVSGGSAVGATSASSSAFPGSYVGITVSLDYTTLQSLDPAGSPYNGTVTIAASSAVNGSFTVALTLNIAAGAPSYTSVFPQAVNALMPGAAATNNFIFTLVGNNFFTTSAVSLQQGAPNSPVGQSIALPQPTYLSRQVLQVTVNQAYFTMAAIGPWFLKVGNPVAAINPALPPAFFPFMVVDPTQPTISGVVNAASYQPASVWAGVAPGTDPLTAPGVSTSAVSPREIVSIFGQNLGPSVASTAQPLPISCPGVTDGSTNCLTYGTSWGGVIVMVSYTDPVNGPQMVLAPLLMTSMNQVNAIVPRELSVAIGQQVTIAVSNNGLTTQIPFTATVLQENPGMFTFGGLGQGQGAIINYDSTGTVTSVNSTKNAEPRGNTIAVYVTGMGELSDPTVGTGDIVSVNTNPVQDQTVRVDIGGQPCVVNYAGTADMTVAGLVQINAVVPPNAPAGQTESIVVSIGAVTTARKSQPGVTVAVK
jgi:uncharacterized protein (TIGR03437 family)